MGIGTKVIIFLHFARDMHPGLGISSWFNLYVWLTWLIPRHSQWSICHGLLDPIQPCVELLPLSSSSCTCSPPSTSLSQDPFSKRCWVISCM